MLTTGQIILRLTLSLIFGFVFYIFNKQDKSISFKTYPLIFLLSTITAFFILEILINVYSKVEITLLPAILILGIFIFSQAVFKLSERLEETLFFLFRILLTMMIGFLLGMGFYRTAFFAAIFVLIFLTIVPSIENLIKKLWRSR